MSVIKNIVKETVDAIDSLSAKEYHYQSPLEVIGIVRRQAMKPVRYYGKQYPYAVGVTDSVLRYNDTYVSTTGWRPSTYKLVTTIQDNEFENISNEFEMR